MILVIAPMVFRITLAILVTGIAAFSQPRIEYSPLSDTAAISAVSLSAADSVFAWAQQLAVIDYNDCNICKSRAHILAHIIEKRFANITVSKVWLFAGPKIKSRRSAYRTRPELWLQHKNICSGWGYHVAPVIVTSGDTLVIDPATQTRAVSLGEWASSLVPSGGEGLVVIKHRRFYIFPDNEKHYFEDEKILWTDNESLLDESYSRSIDEMTRTSLGIAEPWQMRSRVKQLEELINE